MRSRKMSAPPCWRRVGRCGVLCWLALGALRASAQDASAAVAPVSATAQLPEAPAASTGTVSGTVTDANGVLVTGASVLLNAVGGIRRQTATDRDGNYVLRAVPAGNFSITVTLPGFVAGSALGVLAPGQNFEVPEIALKLAAVTVEVDVTASQYDIAEEQMRVEEKQRLIGFLPNFFVSYDWKAQPLSPGQKYRLAWKNARDPGNLVLVGLVSGVQQATDAFPGYGQGAQGYGKRYGANLANLVSGTMLGGAVLPTLFHQDPRYFYKGTGTVKSRLWYAITRAVVARGDDGNWQPAYASVLGDLSAGAISNLYYAKSDRQGAALTIENGFLGIAGDAMNGVFQEFLLKKVTPSARKGVPSAP